MIASRQTWILKLGCTQQALELAQAERARVNAAGTPIIGRYYIPITGPRDVLVFESEWESLEARNKWYDEWGATPEAQAFYEKWVTLQERGGTHELWHVS